ncbi:Rsp5p-dependent ubiquitination, sorting of cargo proteins at the multivesicular body, partial [Quaeritorhiza haematococci]
MVLVRSNGSRKGRRWSWVAAVLLLGVSIIFTTPDVAAIPRPQQTQPNEHPAATVPTSTTSTPSPTRAITPSVSTTPPPGITNLPSYPSPESNGTITIVTTTPTADAISSGFGPQIFLASIIVVSILSMALVALCLLAGSTKRQPYNPASLLFTGPNAYTHSFTGSNSRSRVGRFRFLGRWVLAFWKTRGRGGIEFWEALHGVRVGGPGVPHPSMVRTQELARWMDRTVMRVWPEEGLTPEEMRDVLDQGPRLFRMVAPHFVPPEIPSSTAAHALPTTLPSSQSSNVHEGDDGGIVNLDMGRFEGTVASQCDPTTADLDGDDELICLDHDDRITLCSLHDPNFDGNHHPRNSIAPLINPYSNNHLEPNTHAPHYPSRRPTQRRRRRRPQNRLGSRRMREQLQSQQQGDQTQTTTTSTLESIRALLFDTPFPPNLGVLPLRSGLELKFNTHTGPGSASTCLSNLPIYYTTTERFCYFEVEILFIPRGSCLSVGLATSPHLPFRLPGWSKWSIGFQNDGVVYADEAEGFEGEDEEEMPRGVRYFPGEFKTGDIVGCGYDQQTGTVFWTLTRPTMPYTLRLPDAFVGRFYRYHAAIGHCSSADRNNNNGSGGGGGSGEGARVRVNFGTEDFAFADANEGLNEPDPPPG